MSDDNGSNAEVTSPQGQWAPGAPAAPEDVDVNSPAASRIYDWYLGGNYNFAVDREFGKRMVDTLPVVRECAVANRGFLRRAVAWLADQGIDQFLDIGSGVPTVGNVHEIAQRENPRAHTVYVDYEPVAVSNANLILNDTNQPFPDPERAQTAVIQADFRSPDTILNHPDTQRLLDFDRPIALLLFALLPFIGPADDPRALLDRYRAALPSGSYLAMSQITDDGVPDDMVDQMRRFAASYHDTPNPVYLRTHQEFTGLFAGWNLVEPGIVWAPQWHPYDGQLSADPSRAVFMAGVAQRG